MNEIVNEKTKAYLKDIGCKATSYLGVYSEICKQAIELDIKSFYTDDITKFYVSIYNVHTQDLYETLTHYEVEDALDEAIELIYKHNILNYEQRRN